MIGSLIFIEGCAFYVGVDYTGQTAKDWKSYTEKEKK